MNRLVPLTFLGLSLAACAAIAAPRPPNLLILLADDLGYGDTGFTGSKDIQTPNLDRLAATGVRLDRFYACPMCSPTRAGLLTGRWPIRYGLMRAVIPPWSEYGLPASEATLPELLARAGYERRGMVGKWHLGHSRRALLPPQRGFTSFYGHYNGAIDYFTHEREGETDWHEGNRTVKEPGYSTDLLAREAVRFIAASPPDAPWLLYAAFNAPHGPLQAKPDDLARYESLKGKRRAYAAMIDCLDQAIGRILAAVEARPDAADTLILFCSDNGGVASHANNGPYRDGKLTVYEGGIRVSAAIRWPAGGLEGGRTCSDLLGYVDIAPTLLRAAGAPLPAGEHAFDGIDMLPILRGTAPAPARPWFSYIDQARQAAAAVHDGDWKLVARGSNVLDPAKSPSPHLELYHLAADPAEKHDLATAHPDRVQRLAARLVEFGRLQNRGVGAYADGRTGFKAPKDWIVTD